MNQPAILTRPSSVPGQQNQALVRIYVAYRSLLSVVLLIMLVSPNTRQMVGVLNPSLYMGVGLFYLASSVPLVAFLAGPASAGLSGQIIRICGGSFVGR